MNGHKCDRILYYTQGKELNLKNEWNCLHTILHHYIVTNDISVHELFKEELTELPYCLPAFYQYHKRLHRGGWLGVVGSHGSGGEKHVKKLDLQIDSDEALLYFKYHKSASVIWWSTA